jgi:hypothetical protein
MGHPKTKPRDKGTSAVKRNALSVCALLCLLSPSPLAPQTSLNWPEVMDRLTRERTQAETCVGLIKSGGDKAAIERAKLSYAKAKAEMDGVIAGLRTVLVRAGDPNSLPTVRTSLDAAGQCLKEICDAASQAVSPNTKGVLEAIANSAVEPLIQTIAPRADATSWQTAASSEARAKS